MVTNDNLAKSPDPEVVAILHELARRAQDGDAEALPALCEALDALPEVWRRHGDLALLAEESWLRLVAGENLLLRESVRHKLAALRAELTGPEPTPLERQLVARVVLCWLQVQYSDICYAQLPGRGATPAQRTEAQQRQNASQHRYLHALRTLAAVRKLLRPVPSLFDLSMRPIPETPVPTRRGTRAAAPSAAAAARN